MDARVAIRAGVVSEAGWDHLGHCRDCGVGDLAGDVFECGALIGAGVGRGGVDVREDPEHLVWYDDLLSPSREVRRTAAEAGRGALLGRSKVGHWAGEVPAVDEYERRWAVVTREEQGCEWRG